MKLSIYVVNKSGINLLSIFRSTRFATAVVACSPSGAVLGSAMVLGCDVSDE
jgi:hypothetical protein